jgi:hypothetical protein
MADYLEKIYEGLILEEPKTIIPWDLKEKDVFNKLEGVSKMAENYYSLEVKLADIPFIDCIGLQFKKGWLSSIDLFFIEENCSEEERAIRFDEYQAVLKNLFGRAHRKLFSEWLNGYVKVYEWKFLYISMIHKLWDRFGLEENLSINIGW